MRPLGIGILGIEILGIDILGTERECGHSITKSVENTSCVSGQTYSALGLGGWVGDRPPSPLDVVVHIVPWGS